MNKVIILELGFFINSILWGGVIRIIYDCLCIFRNVIKHKAFFIALEDILYWVVCSILIFKMMYQQNNGIIRGFSIVGMLIGMLLYHVALSELVVHFISKLLSKIKYVIGRTLSLIFRPFTFLLGIISKITGKILNKVKKGAYCVLKLLKKKKKSSKIPVKDKGNGDLLEK
jgi:spore cortex biosynthesis protein YabQ